MTKENNPIGSGSGSGKTNDIGACLYAVRAEEAKVHECYEELHKNVVDLLERLAPVLSSAEVSPEVRDVPEAKSERYEPKTPLGHEITESAEFYRAMIAGFRTTISVIEDARKRLELP